MKYVFLLSFLVACASGPAQLSDQAKEIEVAANKPVGCSTMGKVVGHDKNGSKDMALNDALNQAAKLGANSLHINQEVPNGRNMVVYATAYLCE